MIIYLAAITGLIQRHLRSYIPKLIDLKCDKVVLSKFAVACNSTQKPAHSNQIALVIEIVAFNY